MGCGYRRLIIFWSSLEYRPQMDFCNSISEGAISLNMDSINSWPPLEKWTVWKSCCWMLVKFNIYKFMENRVHPFRRSAPLPSRETCPENEKFERTWSFGWPLGEFYHDSAVCWGHGWGLWKCEGYSAREKSYRM